MYATFFVIMLLWQPTIINYSFSVFMCVEFENGKTYLRKDTDIECWQGINLIYQWAIGAGFIILWGLIFPVAIFLTIRNIRTKEGNLNNPENLLLFGIFYIGFTDDTFYWEILIMNIRKFFIILTATFFSSS